MSKPDPQAVRATFETVASRYDLANHFLSGGIDYYWRRQLVKMAAKGSCQQILDLATGSGDVLFALRKGLPEKTEITGVDFCEPMLQEAKNKREAKGLDENSNKFLVTLCFISNQYF